MAAATFEFGVQRNGHAVRLMVGCAGCRGITTQDVTPDLARRFANVLLAAADELPITDYTPPVKGTG